MATFSGAVWASDDDARNINGDGTFSSTVSTNHLGKFWTTDYWTGVRWTNVTIPQWATIVSATVEFYSAQVTAWTTAKTIWYAIAEDNATTFSNTTAHKPEWKNRSTASVTRDFTVSVWSANLWFTTGETIDATTLLQETVNRWGWVSGNAFGMVGHDNWSADSNYVGYSTYDRDSARWATLDVTYTVWWVTRRVFIIW